MAASLKQFAAETVVLDDQQASERYQLLKLAWQQYQTGPENLEQYLVVRLQKQAAVAQRIIDAVLFSEQAKEFKLLEQEVDFVVDELKKQFEDADSFAICLHEQGISYEQLRLAVYQDLLSEKIIAAQSEGIEVSEQEALDYYLNNKQQFLRPELRKVSHILITINDEFSDNKRAAVSKKMHKLRQQLLDDPTLFASLAMAHSECPTALQEGLLGEVKPGQLYPELDKALFAMQENSLSEVLESETGLHLLYCHSITPPYEHSQEEAIALLIKQMTEHKKKQQQKRWMASLFKK